MSTLGKRTVRDPLRQLHIEAMKVRNATLDRDGLIRQLRARGHSLRDIAAHADLSHSAIAKICARTTPEKETTNVR